GGRGGRPRPAPPRPRAGELGANRRPRAPPSSAAPSTRRPLPGLPIPGGTHGRGGLRTRQQAGETPRRPGLVQLRAPDPAAQHRRALRDDVGLRVHRRAPVDDLQLGAVDDDRRAGPQRREAEPGELVAAVAPHAEVPPGGAVLGAEPGKTNGAAAQTDVHTTAPHESHPTDGQVTETEAGEQQQDADEQRCRSHLRGLRYSDTPAALSRTCALAAARAPSGSDASARWSALRARATSISSASSAYSASTVTLSGVIDRNPPCTASVVDFPSVPSTRTTAVSSSCASVGSWPGRMPISPSVVRARTKLASPDQIRRSTATSSTFIVATISPGPRASCGSCPGRPGHRRGRTPARARRRTHPWRSCRTPRWSP